MAIARIPFQFAFLLAALVIENANAALGPAPDAGARGPHAVRTGEYKLPAYQDDEVLATAPIELWARVHWPEPGPGPRPIVFLLHGNHATCGSQDRPRSRFDCKYTLEGACPDGMSVIPNHDGLRYLAEHLASHGFVAVSINANRGINCGFGFLEDEALIFARGRLILRHIERWHRWSTEGGLPPSLGLAPDAFKGRIDLGEVGLLGHSRGGHGARAALGLANEVGSPWPERVPGLRIKGVFEIGATDTFADRELDADGAAWNQLIPLCDGDVYGLEGRRPFERMMADGARAAAGPKSLLYVRGANHNFFNTEWHVNDSPGCFNHEPLFGSGATFSPAQQKVAMAGAAAFFLAHLRPNVDGEFAKHFDPLFALPDGHARAAREYSIDRASALNPRLEEFDQPTGYSSARLPHESGEVSVEHDASDLPYRATVKWLKAGPGTFFQLNWSAPGQGRSFSGFATLDLRVGRDASPYNAEPSTDFALRLIAADGRLSAPVRLRDFAELDGPWHEQEALYQTVRIPLAAFAGVDLRSVRGLRFVFDGTPTGSVRLAQVRLSSVLAYGLAAAPAFTPVTRPACEGTKPLPRRWFLARLESASQQRAKPVTRTARLVSVRRLASAAMMRGKPAVEIVVAAAGGFPVLDQLPVLDIEGAQFAVSRFVSAAKSQRLAFYLPADAVDALAAAKSARVQYGRRDPRLVWTIKSSNK